MTPPGIPNHPRRRAAWSVASRVACALVATACGYAYGIETFDAPGGVRRVAVEVADNRTFRQDFEVGLTREIHRALVAYSDLRPGPRAGADAILRVEIDSLVNEALVVDATPVREGSLDFETIVRLVDRSTGDILRERRVVDRGEFRLPLGETAATASDEALSDLARKIVLALEGDF